MADIIKIFGENVRKIRLSKGMTLEKLAELTKIRKGYLEKIENGLAKKVTYTQICLISIALKATKCEIFEGLD